MRYMAKEINTKRLCSKRLVIRYLSVNGEEDAALANIREHYVRIFKTDLVWPYPISEDCHAGGCIVPVKEGFLWLPYDWVEKEAGPLYEVEDARLLDADEIGNMREEFLRYSEELCLALSEAQAYTWELERGVDKNKYEKVTAEELAEQIASLNPDEGFCFWEGLGTTGAGHDMHGVRCLNLFDSIKALIGYYGGGFSVSLEISHSHEALCQGVHDYLEDTDLSEGVYILANLRKRNGKFYSVCEFS